MEIEKMVNDTRDFTKRVHEQLGPQVFGDTSTLVAELCRTVGVLSESVLVTEGKRPLRSGASVRLAHDIADVLYMLIDLSNHYSIDLEHTWNEMIQETRLRLDDETFVKTIRDRLDAARKRQQQER
jgi:hypothetical protein